MFDFNKPTEKVFSELQQPALKDVSDRNATIINALFTKETWADRLNYFLRLEPKDIYQLIQEPRMLENITKDIVIPPECPVQTAQEFCYHVIMKKIGFIGKNEEITLETRSAYQKIVDLKYNNTYNPSVEDYKEMSGVLEQFSFNFLTKTFEYLDNDQEMKKLLRYFNDYEKVAFILKISAWNENIALRLQWFDNNEKIASILEYFHEKKIIHVLEYYDEDFKQFSQIPNISRCVNLNKQKIAGILKLFKDSKKIGNVLMWIVTSLDFEWLADIFKNFKDLKKVWNILCSIENTWVIWQILKFFDDTEIAKILKCFDDNKKILSVLSCFSRPRAKKLKAMINTNNN